MFPKNPSPTFASTRTAQSEQFLIDNNLEHARNLRLSDEDIARGAMHIEEQRRQEALIDLHDERQPLPAGWLKEVNGENSSTESERTELDGQWAENKAKFPEQTNAERADGAAVEAIIQITPRMRSVRLSEHTKKELAGMKREDFDLAV